MFRRNGSRVYAAEDKFSRGRENFAGSQRWVRIICLIGRVGELLRFEAYSLMGSVGDPLFTFGSKRVGCIQLYAWLVGPYGQRAA